MGCMRSRTRPRDYLQSNFNIYAEEEVCHWENLCDIDIMKFLSLARVTTTK